MFTLLFIFKNTVSLRLKKSIPIPEIYPATVSTATFLHPNRWSLMIPFSFTNLCLLRVSCYLTPRCLQIPFSARLTDSSQSEFFFFVLLQPSAELWTFYFHLIRLFLLHSFLIQPLLSTAPSLPLISSCWCLDRYLSTVMVHVTVYFRVVAWWNVREDFVVLVI